MFKEKLIPGFCRGPAVKSLPGNGGDIVLSLVPHASKQLSSSNNKDPVQPKIILNQFFKKRIPIHHKLFQKYEATSPHSLYDASVTLISKRDKDKQQNNNKNPTGQYPNNSVHIVCHINRLMDKTMIISMQAGKAFNKIQKIVSSKNIQQLGLEKELL